MPVEKGMVKILEQKRDPSTPRTDEAAFWMHFYPEPNLLLLIILQKLRQGREIYNRYDCHLSLSSQSNYWKSTSISLGWTWHVQEKQIALPYLVLWRQIFFNALHFIFPNFFDSFYSAKRRKTIKKNRQ